MSKIYTKTGDKGTTGLLSGERIAKDSARVEAYGSVDEINSALGMARAFCVKPEVKDTVLKLQKLLMLLMADLASKSGETRYITDEHVKVLEETIDKFDAVLPPLNHFIMPGDNQGAAALDLARTTTRRAERRILHLATEETVSEAAMIALNRLSDLCFVLSRVETQN